jgi:Tfp pilus assembly protein PilN
VNNSLNLASRPFSNRILPWALTAIILFVSLIGLILVVRLTTTAKAQADKAQIEINKLKQEEHALMKEAETLKAAFTADQQQALPAAHLLVDRKLFSWSQLLADLEASLPNNVRVSRISVQDVTRDANQTVAQLELAVFTKNPATISDMIAAMHKEGTFYLVLRNQNLQKGRGEAGTEYEFSVVYRAQPGYSSSESLAEAGDARKSTEVPR